MVDKITIHEICPKCGKVAAFQESDGSVCVNTHDCSVVSDCIWTHLQSFRPGEVTFVPASESLTNEELVLLDRHYSVDDPDLGHKAASEIRMLRNDALRREDVIGISLEQTRIAKDDNTKMRAKNKQSSSDIREMARDCTKLQKVLLDIGHKVNDVLGQEVCGIVLDLVGRVSPQNSWQCNCGVRNGKNLDSCCNCGRSKQC